MVTDRKQGEETKQSRWGFRGKTVWDWMALLIVPLALVVIGLLFTMLQDARQQEIEDQRAQQAQKIENQRAEAERELAEQRAQDEALQAYLDQMSQLMLERKLLEAEQGTPVHTLAQARTSTAIFRLDAEHNESVTTFLVDSGLAVSGEASPRLLRGIALENATLSDAVLEQADLSYADLSGANLSGAFLNGANLSGANLSRTDLGDANLVDPTNPVDPNLSGARLEHADLSGAFLNGADLSGANLLYADLSGADLRRANLRGAMALTDEKIAAAESLEGATMPDGQKYEDWLKSEGSGKD